MNILTVQQITKIFGEKGLFKDASFGIGDTEKIGIIGVNGAGKSTLLRIIAGEEETDSGEVIKMNNLKIAYLPQNPEFSSGESIIDYILRGKNTTSKWDLDAEAKSMLNRLGFTDYDRCCDNLSGGEKKKIALTECLVSDSDLLILDEPTNHLDKEMVEWLEKYLRGYKGAVILVSHDRYFLDIVTDKMIEIDDSTFYTYESNYSGFLQLKNKRIEEMILREQKRQNTLRIETAWVRRGARARSTKQKARLKRYEELKSIEAPKLESEVTMESVASRMGKKTIILDHISKGYDGRNLIKDFTYSALRTDRLGIVGHNGCGKSTLLRIIAGLEKADSGTVEIGDTIKIGYFAQDTAELLGASSNERIIDYIRDTAEFINTPSGKISAAVMLERFLFEGPQQYTLVSKLSGGEKRRIALLKVIMEAPNVLILDEPTNDLDIATLTVLEDFLSSFAGIVITVSHDRYFLDNVVDRIMAFEDDGVISQYDGNYSDYIEKTKGNIGKADKSQDDRKKQSGQAQNDAGGAKKSYQEREKKLKFTYKEAKEFETIEDDIAKLEEDIDNLDKRMAECARDFVKLGELSKEKEEKEEELLLKMERWEYLTDLNERIEAQK